MSVRFLSNESGAITVDWVVMAAALAGLSIAAANQISGGITNLTGRLDGELGTSSISARPSTQVLASMSFTDADDEHWTGGEVISPIASLGEILVLSAGETTTFEFDIPEDRDKAIMSFDLIGGDSLDTEVATIKVNGQTVSLATGKYNGTMSFSSPDLDGVTIETFVVSQGTNLGGAASAGWKDTVTTVTITVEEPGDTLTFAMQSGANQGIADEFFAIDNFNLSAK